MGMYARDAVINGFPEAKRSRGYAPNARVRIGIGRDDKYFY